MADDFDRASDAEMRDRELLLKAHSALSALVTRMAPSGECHNPLCGEPFHPDSPKLFCDDKCAKQHSLYKRK